MFLRRLPSTHLMLLILARKGIIQKIRIIKDLLRLLDFDLFDLTVRSRVHWR
jgi:hypothetical protein